MRCWAGLMLLMAIGGCANPPVEYRPVPYHLIPSKPDLPAITSERLRCIDDTTYYDLANRDRMLRQYSDELRALLDPRESIDQ